MSRAGSRTATRLTFVTVVAGFALWGFGHSGNEVREALAMTSWSALALALLLVVLGLTVTAVLWRHILGAYGHRLPLPQAMAIFFIGQLGKYVPGSVWSIGAQARMAAGHGVPARTTVSASLVFLMVHVATGLLAAASLGACLELSAEYRRLIIIGGAVTGAVLLVPEVARRFAARTGGRAGHFAWRVGDLLGTLAAMGAVWACYGSALTLVLPQPSVPDLVPVTVAFALGYVAGVAVPFAPAGLGAREGMVLLILVPALGVGPAGAVAVLGRVLHTIADFTVAGGAWALARRHVSSPSAHSELSEVPD